MLVTLFKYVTEFLSIEKRGYKYSDYQGRMVHHTTRHYFFQVGYLIPEKSIPDAILKQAKGLAILTVAKVGVMVTYNIGTGIVVARRQDGSWSPPSAISSFGIGWGAQVKYMS